MNEFVLTGRVVYGKQLGRTIGFPTANMDIETSVECRTGVYYASCNVDGTIYRVILNIGTHPTVPEGPPTVEAHLIGFSGDLYGQQITVKLLRYMREEKKFPSLQALTEQLNRDMNTAKGLPLEE